MIKYFSLIYLWTEKVDDTVTHSFQSDTSDEEQDQNAVRKESCHIHQLEMKGESFVEE